MMEKSIPQHLHWTFTPASPQQLIQTQPFVLAGEESGTGTELTNVKACSKVPMRIPIESALADWMKESS